MSLEEEEGDAYTNKSIEARLADLIIYRDQAKRRIAELEATVNTLPQNCKNETHSSNRLRRKLSAPLVDQPFKENALQEISQWNKDLVDTVNELRGSMLKMETDAKVQIILLKEEVERLRAESELLRRENEALKERVADDVLRQRQTNRVEMAFEKARIASRVRTAGLRRLESLEAILMETHDDLYFVQRFDAGKLPVRDVTFVIHIVANVSPSHVSGEEFTMNIYQELLLGAARKHNGYYIRSVKQMEIFAFHSATAALNFSKACHVALTSATWPCRTTDIPHFSPVIDNGEVLYSGPRVHTCIYTCNPGSEVDPINGRSVYYGQEIRQALLAALHGAPVGEIVANRAWGERFCREVNILNDINSEIILDVECVREKMGPDWSVIAFESDVRELFCSILPKTLERRRGLPPYYLHPTPRFPHGIIDVENLLPLAISSMKGVNRLSLVESQQQQQQQHLCKKGWTDDIFSQKLHAAEKTNSSCTDLLSIYRLRKERANIISLYKNLEEICAFHEQTAMEAEDWHIVRLQSINPGEILFVCTVDIGDDELWGHITNTFLSSDEQYHMRDQIRANVLSSGRKYEGVHVNGNNRDIFVFAFRRTEQVLRFVTDVYAVVSQNCETFTKTDMCLMRAGITMGTLHSVNELSTVSSFEGVSAIGNGNSGSMLLCRGATMNFSCYLCDSAKTGEILAVADVMQAFYATKANLTGMEYNVVKECSRFLGSHSTLVDVYSVLPRSYAYRRQESKQENNKSFTRWQNISRRATKTVLQLYNRVMRLEDVKQLLLRQQEIMERGEAAMMSEHDDLFSLNTQGVFRLPWPVVSKSQIAQTATEVSFFFCDAADVSSISRVVSDEMHKEIMAQYNFAVKEAVLAHDGFIAKTDSITAYIVIFSEPYRAVEAALQIQRQLLALAWPNKVNTLEPTLYVRSAKTGIVLFRGVRARMVVHVSKDYQYTQMGRSDNNAVCLLGPALKTVAELGSQACGGEILLTQQALCRIKSTLHGSLLMNEMALRVAKSQSDGQTSVASCVPQLLLERFDLFTPVAITVSNTLLPPVGREKLSHKKDGSQVWWQNTSNPMAPLPPSHLGLWGRQKCPNNSSISPSILLSLDNIMNYMRKEAMVSTDLGISHDNLMTFSRDILQGLGGIFRVLDDGIQSTTTTAAAAAISRPLAPNAVASVSEFSSPPSFNKVNNANILQGRTFRKSTPTTAGPTSSDSYKRALQTLDEILRGVLHRLGHALGGGNSAGSALVLPNLRTSRNKYTNRDSLMKRAVKPN